MSIPQKPPKILAIVGPTASGKTALAISLAKRWNGEIVSADSRQIYRGMDVGTAKPSREKNSTFSILYSPFVSNGIPHYLLDIKNPNENYTLAEYKRDAVAAIKNIIRRRKLPIIVGGTGLYIRAILQNLDIPKVQPNQKLRNQLEDEIQKKGLAAIFQKLVALDPEAAYIVDPKNPRRVIRALEITMLTKTPFSAQRKKGNPLFDSLEIGVIVPPEKLRIRIEKRVDEMVRDGLFYEVKTLTKKYGNVCIAFDAIGYREVIDCMNEEISRAEATLLIKKTTWSYAKRQMTWFRKDTEIQWIKNETEAENLIRNFLAPLP